MQVYHVKPHNKPLYATVRVPGSKSMSNRAFLLAALSPEPVTLYHLLESQDTIYMAKALDKVGIFLDWDTKTRVAMVKGGKRPTGNHTFFVGNAGTAMRFLVSYMALGEGDFVLDGDERMRQRPIEDLLRALRELGVEAFSQRDNGCPPVLVRGRGVDGGVCHLPGERSSQYVSSLLMASPQFCRETEILVEGDLASKPYADMTIAMMGHFGVEVKKEGYTRFFIQPQEYRSPGKYAIEADASSASYFLAMVAILGGEIRMEGVGSESLQGDSRFASVLAQMGCEVEYESQAVVLRSDGRLKGIEIDLNDMPDLVPTLAVVALFAEGETKIRNVANLRIKECDRLSALAKEFAKIGAEVEEGPDFLVVQGKRTYHGAQLHTYEDHRMAMAFSLIGLRVEGVAIENPGCVSKSFPEYFEYFEAVVYGQGERKHVP
ncbi:MAG: 3-phosphoshikimate 1-carboxyvinyltransferase [Brevinematales bacterium]|nr:3-phosphoshikimate 1-carboxyvinyltransferase [Brevinematales bacterium]